MWSAEAELSLGQENGLQYLTAPKSVLQQVSLYNRSIHVKTLSRSKRLRREVVKACRFTGWIQTLQTGLQAEKMTGQDMTAIIYHDWRPPALVTIR